MGDLAPGDAAAMRRRLKAERDSGRWVMPVGPNMSFADGSLGQLLARKGYKGSFIWSADPLRAGRRMVELTDADDPAAWTVGDHDE